MNFRIANLLIVQFIQTLHTIQSRASNVRYDPLGLLMKIGSPRCEATLPRTPRQIPPTTTGERKLPGPVRYSSDEPPSQQKTEDFHSVNPGHTTCAICRTRPTSDLIAGLQETHRRFVVDRFGVHAADERHVVDNFLSPWEQFGDPHSALASLFELEL